MIPSRLRLALCGIALAMWAAPHAASACREYQFPRAVTGASDVVVVASVIEAAFTGDQSRFYTWKARAKVHRVVLGSAPAREFEFWGAWESNGCTRQKPPPAPGEQWVLYLKQTPDGLKVTDALPLPVAEEIDERFGGRPRPPPVGDDLD